jgi:hypothetical protein
MKKYGPSLLMLAAALPLVAADPTLTGFPFTDESLHYSINWPSGLSLGDANLTAHHSPAGWSFDVTVDAGIPGFSLADKYRASANADLCSTDLDRDMSHGGKKTHEKTTFDQKAGTAHRVTVFPDGGGQSDVSLPMCARDALSFLYYARKELGQGRVPPQQQVFFGSSYSARMEYLGAVDVATGKGKPATTDRLMVYVKGPKSDFQFEVFFARDAARTPLTIKLPVSAGTLTMELVR